MMSSTKSKFCCLLEPVRPRNTQRSSPSYPPRLCPPVGKCTKNVGSVGRCLGGLIFYIVSYTKHQFDELNVLATSSLPCFMPQPSNKRLIIQITHCKKYQISLTGICRKLVLQPLDESMENEPECQIIVLLLIYVCSEY